MASNFPTIRQGCSGSPASLAIQIMLFDLGYIKDKAYLDADYGSYSAARIKEFQKKHGLTQDGIVGPKTWPVLIREWWCVK